MDIMKPIATVHAPTGKDWVYEVKYDGFRGQLFWTADSIQLISRNGHNITILFPEIIAFCSKHQSMIQPLLPLTLDGELVVLNHTYQANFSLIQQRGRLKKMERIEQAAEARPAAFLAFDILRKNGISFENRTFEERKKALRKMYTMMGLPMEVDRSSRLSYVPAYQDMDERWNIIMENKAEGMVAKRLKSIYHVAKQHQDWYKVKNWRTIEGFLTFFNVKNDYFTVQVYANETQRIVGKCKHGLRTDEEKILKTLFKKNGNKEEGGYSLPPAICARIHTLDLNKKELREPAFVELLPEHNASDCTEAKLHLDLAMLPRNIEISNTDKIFWPNEELTKGDLLFYMREITPYMLPFLKEKTLTIIRSPDGAEGEHFFQKHLPDYAPGFIRFVERDGEKLIVCDHFEALIWFANHGAIEYHTPFEMIDSSSPAEIVFDLDPPDVARFSLAKQAALMLKYLLDDLELISFVKTSGSKGMQVHIPIPVGSMSYEETAVLTKAIAKTMENREPTLFTTERFKRDRNERLYIDYVQHASGKTIITPYSPRLTNAGSVATPLFWEEVTPDLHPEQFTIKNVVDRVKTKGCPFARFFEVGQEQHLEKVKEML